MLFLNKSLTDRALLCIDIQTVCERSHECTVCIQMLVRETFSFKTCSQMTLKNKGSVLFLLYPSRSNRRVLAQMFFGFEKALDVMFYVHVGSSSHLLKSKSTTFTFIMDIPYCARFLCAYYSKKSTKLCLCNLSKCNNFPLSTPPL